MLLAIDVGNTQIVCGLFDGVRLVHQFRVESARGRTADEYAVIFRQLFSMHAISHEEVEAAIVASVVPALTESIEALTLRAFGRKALVVGPGVKTGMPILVDNPKEVGADRIVNAVAAFEKIQGGVVVVDFGTATTFDCVTPRGEYVGGAIAPGVQISADALFSRAAKLPRVEVAIPPKAVGKNTLHSMQSGIVYGYVGLVDGMVSRLRKELDFDVRVMATGGLAGLIAPLTQTIEEVDDVLTLTGLRLIYARSV